MNSNFLRRGLQDTPEGEANSLFFQQDNPAINVFLEEYPVTELLCAGNSETLFHVKIDTSALPVVLATSTRWRVANFYPKKANRTERFYAYIRVRFKELKVSKTVYLHRVVAQAPVGMEVDHWNHDSLDNRGENLRVVTHGQNMKNRIDCWRLV